MASSTGGFAAAVEDWAKKTEEKLDTVFKLSFQLTKEAVEQQTPVKTGYLLDSLTVTIGDIALIDPDASGSKGGGNAAPAHAAVITGAKLGDTLSAGFVASYARRIEYGFNGTDSLGRHYSQPARAMVRMAVQRFPEFVQAAISRG